MKQGLSQDSFFASYSHSSVLIHYAFLSLSFRFSFFLSPSFSVCITNSSASQVHVEGSMAAPVSLRCQSYCYRRENLTQLSGSLVQTLGPLAVSKEQNHCVSTVSLVSTLRLSQARQLLEKRVKEMVPGVSFTSSHHANSCTWQTSSMR